MKKQRYIVEIEMPDGDFISAGWIKDLIQTDCDVEDESRKKVTVQETSLPSDLDEAAEIGWDSYYNSKKFPSNPCAQSGYKTGFKAGAEWMAGQGVTVECGVRVYPTLDGVAHRWVSLYKNGINIDSLKDIPRLKSLDFKDDDTAIVQIRKK